jgi:hypothetical protein
MSTLELKKSLMHRIAEINDVSFLKAIKTILDSKAKEKTMTLTPEQRFEIIESKKEIKNGLFINQLELDKDVNQWLSTR